MERLNAVGNGVAVVVRPVPATKLWRLDMSTTISSNGGRLDRAWRRLVFHADRFTMKVALPDGFHPKGFLPDGEPFTQDGDLLTLTLLYQPMPDQIRSRFQTLLA